MKKTLRTVITAAMFAAANMSSLPASAEQLASDDQLNWKELIDSETGSSDRDGSDKTEINSSNWDDLEVITGQNQYNMYGAESIFGVNRFSDDWRNSDSTGKDADVDLTTTTGTVPPMVTTTTTAPQPLYGPVMSIRNFGDINLDGEINIFDAVAFRKMLVNGMEFSSYDNFVSIHSADINQDDKVNIADFILLQRFLLGKIDSFEINGMKLMMTGKTIETIAAPDKEKPVVTTETATYDPREDIVVSLYGIKPVKDIIDQAVNETKENIDIEISSEDEKE